MSLVTQSLVSVTTGSTNGTEITPNNRKDQGGYVMLERIGVNGSEEIRVQGRLSEDANWIQLGQITASGAATNDESFDGNGWYTDSAGRECYLTKAYPMLPFMRLRVQNVGAGTINGWIVE